MREELEHVEDRLGQEEQPSPIHRPLELGNAQSVLVIGEQRHDLGAGEQPVCDRDLLAGGYGAGGAQVADVIDVHGLVGGGAVEGPDLLGLIGDQRGQPVLVGDAEPTAVGGLVDFALLLPAPVALQLEAVAKPADGALVHVGGAQDVRWQAAALHLPERRDRDRGGALVRHRVGDGEHVLRVHGDGAGERQTLGRTVAEHDRVPGRERTTAARGPERVQARQALQVGADPAELGEIGVDCALRPEQLHRRRLRIQGLVVAAEEQVVEARALQGHRALERRRLDGDARAGRLGLCAADRERRLDRDARMLGRRGRGLGLSFGLPPLARGPQDEQLIGQQHHHHADDEDDRISGVVLHWTGKDRT